MLVVELDVARFAMDMHLLELTGVQTFGISRSTIPRASKDQLKPLSRMKGTLDSGTREVARSSQNGTRNQHLVLL